MENNNPTPAIKTGIRIGPNPLKFSKDVGSCKIK